MGLHLVRLCLLLDLGNQDKTIGTLRSKDDNGSKNATEKVNLCCFIPTHLVCQI